MINLYQEEIEDYLGWEADEAKYRIVGNIRRLNKLGVGNIHLRQANLQEANLWEANLQKADLREAHLQGAYLSQANLQEANLWEANLQETYLEGADLQKAFLFGANLQEAWFEDANLQGAEFMAANLQKAKYLTLEQLSEAKTLYQAKLDPELEAQDKEKYPHLLKEAPAPPKKFRFYP